MDDLLFSPSHRCGNWGPHPRLHGSTGEALSGIRVWAEINTWGWLLNTLLCWLSDNPCHLYILSGFLGAFPCAYYLIFTAATHQDPRAWSWNTPKAGKLVPNRSLRILGPPPARRRATQRSSLRDATKFWLTWQGTASPLLLKVEFYSNSWAPNNLVS